ncbi:MAG: flagellar export chaperone FliS [Deltaproteobacteria bacterium]|nr:flagellar export chaperone FliS [Deltaproteobacteria bacterium]MCB9489024.1 flagellar export chaperone FliS [Deltaproteobacteria bacterium]
MTPHGGQIAAYASNDVNTANRLQLLIMLYEGAIRFMSRANEAMKAGNLADKGLYLHKAQAIIDEFKGTLDFSASKDLATELERLYDFITDRLHAANMRNDRRSLAEAMKITGILRDAWVELSEQVGTGTDAHLERAAKAVNENSVLRISV